MKNLDSVLKSKDITLPTKVCIVKAMVFPVVTYSCDSWTVQKGELDCTEGRMPNNWCLRTVMLEKTPESPLGSQETKPVNLKGDQPWIFTGRTDAEAEAPVIWSSDAHRWLIRKSLWCWERWRAEGEEGVRGWDGWMASPMQWKWTWANSNATNMNLGDGEGQGGLECFSPWGCKELDTTRWLNNNNKINTSEQAGLEHLNFPIALINKSFGKFSFFLPDSYFIYEQRELR